MNKALLIAFTPINRFFFGGSYSLEDSFYAESLKFPQPTTVLGCLRHNILVQNGILPPIAIINPKNIAARIGEEGKKLTGTSMVNGLDDLDDNFGIIKKISPVFIVKFKKNEIEDFLFPVSADVVTKKEENEKKEGTVSLHCFKYAKKDGKSSYSGRETEYAILSERNPKLHEACYLGGKDFWKAYINSNPLPHHPYYEEDRIFIAHTSVGIKKNREEEEEEEGMFYTKVDYSLRKGFAFAVIAWLKDDHRLKDGVAFLGGEQSTFLMKVFPLEDMPHPIINMILNGKCDLPENLSNGSNGEKLVALSPVVLDNDSNCKFASAMEHRVVKDMHTTKIIRRAKASKSEAISMISAGAVFYPKEPVSLTVNWTIPYKIGYNYVIKLRR